MITIFLLCKYFKPSTTSLAHVGMKSANEAKSNSSTKWTKSSRVQRLFATPNGRKSKQEYSIIIEWFFTKFKEPDYQSCGLLYYSTVRLLSRNRISSQWTRHYCFWQPLFLVFPLYFARYTDPNVPQPNLFSFSKSFHSNFGNSGSFFAFLFRLVGILKLAAILFHLTKREKPWERVSILVKFWREIVVLVRVLLIESSPRFTNRVQSAFY